MIERDYILRMIQQLARFLARIVRNKEERDYEQALEEIDIAYTQLLGLDPQLVRSLPDNEIVAVLEFDGTSCPEKCLAIAQLLKEEAEILELRGIAEERAHRWYEKAFRFYMEALTRKEDLRSETHLERIGGIVDRMQTVEIDEGTKVKLLAYFEMTGKFAKAEDILFELVETEDPRILREGIRFYRRLLEKSNDELNSGDLPREEVEEGLHILTAKLAATGGEIDPVS